MSPTRVVHRRGTGGNALLVDRGSQHASLRNPIPLRRECPVCKGVHERELDALACFQVLFLRRMRKAEHRDEVRDLQGRVLACTCKPHACHADTIAAAAETMSLASKLPILPTVAFVGHEATDQEAWCRSTLELVVLVLRASGIKHFITGMRAGFESWAAHAIAPSSIDMGAQAHHVLESSPTSVEIHEITDAGLEASGAQTVALDARNDYLADKADLLITSWNGDPTTNTGRVVQLARRQGARILHLDTALQRVHAP